MNALSVANVQIGNIQIGNDKIGNDKIRNAVIGRMEWPFSATVVVLQHVRKGSIIKIHIKFPGARWGCYQLQCHPWGGAAINYSVTPGVGLLQCNAVF